MSRRPRVWVTRAEPGAARTTARLIGLGFDPVVRPLLALDHGFRSELSPGDIEAAAALAFTSVNAVQAFRALGPAAARPVFAVGDATAQAAREAGFSDVRSADGALGALAVLIAERWEDWSGPLLALTAAEPAGDLTGLLRGRVQVRTRALYRTIETGVAPPEAFDAVLVHSLRAAHALAATLPPADAVGRTAVALSDAVAAPLACLPFPAVRVAEAPTEAALLEALGAALGKPRPRV